MTPEKITTLAREVDAHEKVWSDLDVRARPHVLDEMVQNEMQRVRSEYLRDGLQLVTEPALVDYEDAFRGKLDTALAVDLTTTEVMRATLLSETEAAIAAGETLPSERDLYGTSTANALQAGVLEELQLQRVKSELGGLTPTQLLKVYASWQDERERTAVRFIEAAVTTPGGLDRLGLQRSNDDVEADVFALEALQRRVAERRRGRVPAALYDLRDRLTALRTMTRQHTIGLLNSGRGIAKRPHAMRIAT
jgi:hypothetical protein